MWAAEAARVASAWTLRRLSSAAAHASQSHSTWTGKFVSCKEGSQLA